MPQTGTQRNPGLDLLRLLSMGMVVLLHLLGRGGILQAVQPFTAHYWAVWTIETAAYCAVDCYALLSGYLLVYSRCRRGSLAALWLQVFCYSAGITALFALFYEPVTLWRFLKSCLPVSFTQYWYFTAYFAVYCLAPFWNRLLRTLPQRSFQRLLASGFFLLCLLPTVFGQDMFVTGNAANGQGYSFLWLTALYFAGAYLRRFPLRSRSSRVWLVGYVLCVTGMLLFRLLADLLSVRLGWVSFGGWVLRYPSPLVVGAAVCLFQCCLECRMKSVLLRRAVVWMAPASFGVYLLHAQPFVFHSLLNGAVVPLLALPAWRCCLALLGIAAGIFAAGILTDRVRMAVFRLLRLPALCDRVGGWLDRWLPEEKEEA